jgi:hypothetical protein
MATPLSRRPEPSGESSFEVVLPGPTVVEYLLPATSAGAFLVLMALVGLAALRPATR